MKKLLVSIILVLALILSLSSCSFEDLVGGIFDNFTENEDGYAYTSFTGAEAKDLKKFLGEVIPFAPCDEYYIEGYYGKDDFENGINYYTVGNTAEDFNAYIELFVNSILGLPIMVLTSLFILYHLACCSLCYFFLQVLLEWSTLTVLLILCFVNGKLNAGLLFFTEIVSLFSICALLYQAIVRMMSSQKK